MMIVGESEVRKYMWETIDTEFVDYEDLESFRPVRLQILYSQEYFECKNWFRPDRSKISFRILELFDFRLSEEESTVLRGVLCPPNG